MQYEGVELLVEREGQQMAAVYLVSPALVKKTNDLLKRVQSARGTEELMQNWAAQMDASGALLAEPAAEQAATVADKAEHA